MSVFESAGRTLRVSGLGRIRGTSGVQIVNLAAFARQIIRIGPNQVTLRALGKLAHVYPNLICIAQHTKEQIRLPFTASLFLLLVNCRELRSKTRIASLNV